MKHTHIFLMLAILLVVVSVSARPDQPNMQSAKVNLQNAKAQLISASPNKGGHRAKAIDLVNEAIAEVNRGIAFDRRHNHALKGLPDQPHMQAALEFLRNARSDL